MTNLSTILSEGLVVPLRGYLSGLVLSTAGSSATFSVAAGMATDDTPKEYMNLSSAISKTTSAWAVGSGNGSLDTGSIAASTWYHVYLIKRPDTGVVDVLISLSATSPTMPTNYTLKRRIGSLKTDGSSNWTAFLQIGDTFIWTASAIIQNSVAGVTTITALSLAAGVPTGVSVEAVMQAYVTVSGAVFYCSIPNTVSVQATWTVYSTAAGAGQFRCFTNTSAQINWKASNTSAASYNSEVLAWIDTRGKL